MGWSLVAEDEITGRFLKTHLPRLLPQSSLTATARPAHSYRPEGSGKQFGRASRALIARLREPNSNTDMLLQRKPGEGATN